MTSHLTEEQIARCRQRILDPAELLVVDKHVMGCAECQRRLRESVEWLPRARALRANLSSATVVDDEHLRAEQLAAYLARRLDTVENELAADHLEFCAQCGERLRAMSQPVIDPIPVSERWRALLSSLRENLRSFTQPAVFPLRAATTAALFVLLAATGYLLFDRAAKSPGPLIVTYEATPSPTPNNEKPAPEQAPSPPVKITPDEEFKPLLAQKRPPSPSFALNDGGRRIAIDETGRVTGLESLPERERELAETAIKSGEAVVAPEITELIGGADATVRAGQRQNPDEFLLLGPLGVAVLSDQPIFRWSRLEGAESYTVAVFSTDYRQVAASPALTVTSWAAPAALERGKVYTWQVKAQKDGREIAAFMPSMAEARFLILGQAQAAQIERAQLKYNGSRLTLGALYAQAGLLDEAEAEFQALLRANPNSPMAQKLLDSVRKLRRK